MAAREGRNLRVLTIKIYKEFSIGFVLKHRVGPADKVKLKVRHDVVKTVDINMPYVKGKEWSFF